MKASTAITAAEPEWGKLSSLELSSRRSEFRELLPRLAPAMRSADFSLVRLGLARVGLDDGMIAPLASALRDNRSIRFLNLADNMLGPAAAKALSTALQHNVTLDTLNVGCNKVGDDGAAAFGAALRHNNALRGLVLSSNVISSVGADALSRGSETCPTLATLELWGNPAIGAAGAAALARALLTKHDHGGLTYLGLRDACIGDDGASALASALSRQQQDASLSTLRRLDLRDCDISDLGASMLAVATASGSRAGHLEQLELWGNNIADEGVGLLAESLKGNSALLRLGLEFNKFGAEGATLLADALRSNKSLTNLGIEGNEIGCDGAAQLGSGLAANGNIRTARLCRAGIGADGGAGLARCLSAGRLTTLDVFHNNLGDEGITSLAYALERDASLLTLRLEHNGVGEIGAGALARALLHNDTLRSLDLSDNSGIGAVGVTALADALHSNRSLKTLFLWHSNACDTGARAIARTLRTSYECGLTHVELQNSDVSTHAGADLDEAVQHCSEIFGRNIRVAWRDSKYADTTSKSTNHSIITAAQADQQLKDFQARARAQRQRRLAPRLQELEQVYAVQNRRRERLEMDWRHQLTRSRAACDDLRNRMREATCYQITPLGIAAIGSSGTTTGKDNVGAGQTEQSGPKMSPSLAAIKAVLDAIIADDAYALAVAFGGGMTSKGVSLPPVPLTIRSELDVSSTGAEKRHFLGSSFVREAAGETSAVGLPIPIQHLQVAAGDTVLHLAARNGKTRVCAQLLVMGLDTKIVNAIGRTARGSATHDCRVILDLFAAKTKEGHNLEEGQRVDELEQIQNKGHLHEQKHDHMLERKQEQQQLQQQHQERADRLEQYRGQVPQQSQHETEEGIDEKQDEDEDDDQDQDQEQLQEQHKTDEHDEKQELQQKHEHEDEDVDRPMEQKDQGVLAQSGGKNEQQQDEEAAAAMTSFELHEIALLSVEADSAQHLITAVEVPTANLSIAVVSSEGAHDGVPVFGPPKGEGARAANGVPLGSSDLTYEEGDTLMHLCARNGAVRCLKLLLDIEFDYAVTNDAGEPPAMVANEECEAVFEAFEQAMK